MNLTGNEAFRGRRGMFAQIMMVNLDRDTLPMRNFPKPGGVRQKDYTMMDALVDVIVEKMTGLSGDTENWLSSFESVRKPKRLRRFIKRLDGSFYEERSIITADQVIV